MRKYTIIIIILVLTGSAFYFSFDRSGADKMKNKKGATKKVPGYQICNIG